MDGRTEAIAISPITILKRRGDKNVASVSGVLASYCWSSEGYI